MRVITLHPPYFSYIEEQISKIKEHPQYIRMVETKRRSLSYFELLKEVIVLKVL